MTDLVEIYERLYRHFGPQHWWPGDTPFEVAVGAVLTQNTNWSNVERAIGNLKESRALSARALDAIDEGELALLIRPAGYYNLKARRLKSFVRFLCEYYGGSMKRMGWDSGPIGGDRLREELLGINGVGPETADSILLYALQKPFFVIDAYTKRVLSRHGCMQEGEPYASYQRLFHRRFSDNGVTPGNGASPRELVPLYNEYHALFVRAGKEYCKRTNPRCERCPLEGV